MHRSGRERFALCVLPRPAHAVGEALGERKPVGRRAVVILARADVSARSVEVYVQGGGDGQLPLKARDAGKIRIRHSGPVVTLRMRRIIAMQGPGLSAISE